MARWAKKTPKTEIFYDNSPEALPDTNERCADAARGLRWRKKLAVESAGEHSFPAVCPETLPVQSTDTRGQVLEAPPLVAMRKGASEMEVAAGVAALGVTSTSSGTDWLGLVGGDPVDEFPSLTPADITNMVVALEGALGFQATQKARRDNHARRKPIPCGVPLLSGHACNYACQYCYLQDWYPFARPTPTPLSGQEVLLSLLYNPHWVPSRDFIILGDACDPFHPDLEARTLEYVEAVAPLRSPIQFSTKSAIPETACARLARISHDHGCSVSVLVTITTIKHAQAVEPLAPSVDQRLQTIRTLSVGGLRVFIFMRPLLPGASDDFADVLSAGKAAGAVGVIVGSLRVSQKIRRRLSRIPVIDIEAIDMQLRDRQIDPESLTEKQVDIQDEPLRAAIKAKADELGLVSVRRACCANAWVARMPCRKRKCLMKDLSSW